VTPVTPVMPALPSGGDRVNPTLSITWPGSTIYATSASVFRIAGTARDNVAVTEVTWEASGTTGIAQGTTSWNAEVPLMVGDNTVIVRARDAAGNTAWRTLLVVRR
jgi:hypothetical protein